MTTKEELVDQLYMLKGFYRLGMATSVLLTDKRSIEILKEGYVVINNKEKLTFEHIIKYLEDPQTKGDVIQQNINIYLRSILLNSFELLKEYCNENGKFNILQKQSWYEIIRIIRNGLGHDLTYDLSRYQEDIFPMQIREYKITKDMDGKPIKLDLVQGHNFSLDMIQFVKQCL